MITVDCSKIPDFHRGYAYSDSCFFYLINYQRMKKTDLDYLLNSILRPYRISIIFSTPLMDTLL